MKIKQIPIGDLKSAEYNPRRLTDKQFKDLRESISRFGAVEPAVVNQFPGREFVIIGGHQRIRVAKSLGMQAYPCFEVSLDEEKERELNVRLNKNTGEFDMDALANFFETDQLLEWGFEASDFGGAGVPGEEGDKESGDGEDSVKDICPHCGQVMPEGK